MQTHAFFPLPLRERVRERGISLREINIFVFELRKGKIGYVCGKKN
jgi:hypothetical protein